MRLFKKREGNLGVDIGSHLVKLVELRILDDGFELINLGVAQLYEVTEEGERKPRSQLIADTVQSLLSSSEVHTRRAAIAVSSREVIVKRIEMDRMSEEEVGQIIRWEAEQHIPFNIDDVYIDFHILDADGDGEQMEVLLVAGKKMNIDSRVQLAKASGLEPVIVDVDAFAVQNAFEINYPELCGEVVCLLNIGRDVSVINLVRGDTPLFIRDVPFGNSTFVEKMRKGLGISVEDVETYLIGIIPDGLSKSEVRPILASGTEDLVVGLTRAFGYLKTLDGRDKPARVIVSGGGARVPGLIGILEERLDVPFETANPLRKLHIKKGLFEGESIEEISPLLMQAVGLSLR
jgi:type IV pilus assembly protein PilM